MAELKENKVKKVSEVIKKKQSKTISPKNDTLITDVLQDKIVPKENKTQSKTKAGKSKTKTSEDNAGINTLDITNIIKESTSGKGAKTTKATKSSVKASKSSTSKTGSKSKLEKDDVEKTEIEPKKRATKKSTVKSKTNEEITKKTTTKKTTAKNSASTEEKKKTTKSSVKKPRATKKTIDSEALLENLSTKVKESSKPIKAAAKSSKNEGKSVVEEKVSNIIKEKEESKRTAKEQLSMLPPTKTNGESIDSIIDGLVQSVAKERKLRKQAELEAEKKLNKSDEELNQLKEYVRQMMDSHKNSDEYLDEYENVIVYLDQGRDKTPPVLKGEDYADLSTQKENLSNDVLTRKVEEMDEIDEPNTDSLSDFEVDSSFEIPSFPKVELKSRDIAESKLESSTGKLDLSNPSQIDTLDDVEKKVDISSFYRPLRSDEILKTQPSDRTADVLSAFTTTKKEADSTKKELSDRLKRIKSINDNADPNFDREEAIIQVLTSYEIELKELKEERESKELQSELTRRDMLAKLKNLDEGLGRSIRDIRNKRDKIIINITRLQEENIQHKESLESLGFGKAAQKKRLKSLIEENERELASLELSNNKLSCDAMEAVDKSLASKSELYNNFSDEEFKLSKLRSSLEEHKAKLERMRNMELVDESRVLKNILLKVLTLYNSPTTVGMLMSYPTLTNYSLRKITMALGELVNIDNKIQKVSLEDNVYYLVRQPNS